MSANRFSQQTVTALPDVSFGIACYNAGAFLQQAVESALNQRGVGVEVLIVDDGSSDGSYEAACAIAERDSRVRVFRTERNSGPGGARNVALREMRGAWFSVLDSDDLIEPERTQALIALAEKTSADIVADDLIVFGEGIAEHRMFDFQRAGDFHEITPSSYFANSKLFAPSPGFGFLKPMFKAEALRRHELKYNESLRIGEDDELIVRALMAGLGYFVTAKAMYRYRKHANSVSHRLSLENATRMLDAEIALSDSLDPQIASSREYRARLAALRDGHAFVKSIDCLKERDLPGALTALARRPAALRHFRMPLRARLGLAAR